MDFIISISCLVAVIALGLSLAFQNNKRFINTHDGRMADYRRRKKAKNEALRQFLGLPEVNSRTEESLRDLD